MADWRECKIGDLLQIKHGFAFLGEHFTSAGTHVVLTPGNFLEEGGFKENSDKAKWYSGPIPADYVLNKGDLIVAMTEQAEGLLGSSALIPRSGIYLHNQRLGLVQILDRQQADQHFIYYLFNSLPVRQQIRGSASGTKIRHTAPSRIADVKVRVPPLPVQQRIAGILSAYDELIENSQRRIKILESMARALYREWFVHFRFPGHENHPRVVSPLGEIPQGWVVTPLGQLTEIRKGKNITRSTIRDGDVPVVAGGVAPAYFHDTPNTQRPVITISASGANAGFVNLYHVDVWASDCSYIDSSATQHIYYFYLWLDHRRSAITHLQRGSAQPHVYPKDLAQLEALSAPDHVMKSFTALVTPIFGLTMRLTAQIQNLRHTRDLLLPRLMSGPNVLPKSIIQSTALGGSQ